VTGQTRVLVYHETDDIAAIQDAYHLASGHLRGVSGLLGNELLHSVHDSTGFVVMSSWENLDAFKRWERGPAHLSQTAPLRPFRDTRMSLPFGVYQVTAGYQAE